ncbi:MAG: O-antigen ligase family protein [bacterium]
MLFKINENNVVKLFKIYLNISFIMALIAIFQEINYLIGFKYGYDFSFFISKYRLDSTDFGLLRVSGIVSEPSQFAISMMPAVFISMVNLITFKKLFINNFKNLIIIISVLLTFSSLAYIGFLLCLIMILFNLKNSKYVITFMLLFVLLISISVNVPEIKERFSGLFSVFTTGFGLENLNLSVFAFASNTLVAYQSFIKNPLFGSGIGSHPISYEKYISKFVDINKEEIKEIIFINAADANSLFLRIVSELGLVGMGILFFFIFKFYISRKKDSFLWIISNAVLSLLLVKLIREGHYFYNGFFFFIWLYYFTYGKIGSDYLTVNK